VDNSNYWTPDLYYRWPNGTYSLVPDSGLTVYYLSRKGATGKNQTDPNWQPIPKGLRMLAGDPTRRNYDGSVKHNAVSYVCLNYNGGGFKEGPSWEGLATNQCPQGLRAQIWFPMCWDGKNLDSADHKSHMSYPISNGNQPNGGDCPNSHPVRIPGLFYEHLYGIGQFPHGKGQNNFVWSMGDPTGYGFHGDFVSGWDPTVMAAAIKEPRCSNDNPDMGFGNNVKNCPPLAPYVKGNNEPDCKLAKTVPLTENLGISKPIKRMPGCWTNTGLLQGCDPSPKGSDNSNVYHIFSVSANAYLSLDTASSNVLANGPSNFLTYRQLWGFSERSSGRVAVRSEESSDVISAQNTAQMVGRVSDWEEWTIVKVAGSNSTVAFKSNRNNQYLSVASDKTLNVNAKSIGNAETFKLSNPDGGYVPKDDGFNSFVRALSVKPAIVKGSN